MVAIQERMQLHPTEDGVIKVAQCLLEVVWLARVGPHQAIGAGNGGNDRKTVGIVRAEDDTTRDLILAQRLIEAISVQRDIKEWKLADVHMSVEDHTTIPYHVMLLKCKPLTVVGVWNVV